MNDDLQVLCESEFVSVVNFNIWLQMSASMEEERKQIV